MNQEHGTKDDYDLLNAVGKGAYGTVYKAFDKQKNRTVAVKIIDLESDWLPLLSEVNMVVDLSHETIVNYFDWFFESGKLWLVMEYCDGGSLSDIMRVLRRPLNEMELSAVLYGVLKSLEYVHSKNRVHRDIKSGNLLLTSKGEIKLCDFGVSAQLDSSLSSKTSTRIGSPYWMAPEVIMSVGHNTKADIWSLGITALELITGHPPLDNFPPLVAILKIPQNPPPEAPTESSEDFKDFIRTALNKDPELRPTAKELLTHKFITKYNNNKRHDIIHDLVTQYKDALENEEDDNEYNEEEEEEEEEEELDEEEDGFSLGLTQQEVSTILFSDSTFCDMGTMVVQEQDKPANSGLSDWKPDFIDSPMNGNENKLRMAQKRNFQHFKDNDLKIMLDSVKKLALSELAAKKIPENVIRENYEDVRAGIVKELQIRNPGKYSDDYEVLK
ncbi:serine/threonine-protein kinase 3 [Histomonas meleagridis]|uniref:serine/threonine-protein kinase 3 n=1 Tax=Histomonas meleagridis TaxID=135588 RepID=UPI003559EFB7|nr:serine/threonine-protein kinase 3 [Histomonas meleagridis]KAH0805160.1 serine/threonine-protein kinase 3 [Histomonas meleagridis]